MIQINKLISVMIYEIIYIVSYHVYIFLSKGLVIIFKNPNGYLDTLCCRMSAVYDQSNPGVRINRQMFLVVPHLGRCD